MLDNEQQPPANNRVLAPSQQNISSQELDEKNEILYVRETRMAINRHLMSDGHVPDDPDKLELLMKNLKDMDSSAIARSRIKSEEKSSQANNEATIMLVNQTLQAMRGGRMTPPVEILDVEAREVQQPVLPVEYERPILPGEMQIGTINEDVDSFRRRMDEQYEAEERAKGR
jgi:hypothetical protein